jgi:hypothetical protein
MVDLGGPWWLVVDVTAVISWRQQRSASEEGARPKSYTPSPILKCRVRSVIHCDRRKRAPHGPP